MSEDANKEELMLRDLESRGVDGLIYVSGYRNQVNRVKELNIPVICVNQLEKMDETMPVIESDHEYGGYLAAKALLERGTERIIMLRDERDILPINQREQGFKAGLKEQHLRPLHISRIPFNVDAAQKK
nr:substrate-binding domain-containing protein [Piscibacillus salipiscarius]